MSAPKLVALLHPSDPLRESTRHKKPLLRAQLTECFRGGFSPVPRFTQLTERSAELVDPGPSSINVKLAERANPGLHGHVASRVLTRVDNRAAAVVDVGCGTGALLVQLRDLGYTNLSGVDIRPPDGIDGIQFHALDLDHPALPFADHSVDLALAVEVLEHIENIGAFLLELRRIIAPGGGVLITTPNVHSVEARLRLLLLGDLKQFDAIGDPTHIAPVFRFPFGRLLGRHGFAAVQTWGFPEDGSSPTSRGALRLMAKAARLFGLRGNPDGDQLCMLLEATSQSSMPTKDSKQQALTAHY